MRRRGRSRPNWPNLKSICTKHWTPWRSRKKRRPRWVHKRGHEMAITVQIPTALRRHTAGVGSIACAATNLGELFSVLDEKFPELKPHLRDEGGQVRRFLNIYVNEEDIRFLRGPEYIFSDGDEVLLVPSIAGGAR